MSNFNEKLQLKPNVNLFDIEAQKENIRKMLQEEIKKELKETFLQSDFYQKHHPDTHLFQYCVGVEYHDEDGSYYNDILYIEYKNGDSPEWAYDWQNHEQYKAGVAFIDSLVFDERDFYFAFGNSVLIELWEASATSGD